MTIAAFFKMTQQAIVQGLLLSGGIGDDAEELKGLPERVFELVKVARPDKQALTFCQLMFNSLLIHGDATPPFDLYHMLIVVVVKRGVASGGNEEMTHYYVARSVVRANEDLHPDIECAFHLHLRCEDLRVVVYLHIPFAFDVVKSTEKHLTDKKV